MRPIKKNDDRQPRQKSDAEIATERATRYAMLKRQASPLNAEIERLSEELKAYFRVHPKVNALGEVGFGIVNRTQLDQKAVRAHLGDRIKDFEKLTPVETLTLLRAVAAAA